MVDAPFPYFGGKKRIAHVVWQALGQPKHYIEPFFGSGAVLLQRPDYQPGVHVETVCDADGHLANVWRALQADPDAVAKVCDWPVNHADLVARKRVLNAKAADLLRLVSEDDKAFDVELAGYWIWAASCWIGHGLVRPGQVPHLSDGGRGVHKLGQVPHLSDGGRGVHKLGQVLHLGRGGKGVDEPYNVNLYEWFRAISERLRYVRVVCGDWSRVCGGDWQDKIGTCGMFFDPPYSDKAERDAGIYSTDSLTVAHDVREWCLGRGDNPRYRIVLAGYVEEHEAEIQAAGWRMMRWRAGGGYGLTSRRKDSPGQANRHREALWFSPHCLGNTETPAQLTLQEAGLAVD